MEFQEIFKLIKPELVIIVVACYALGNFLKGQPAVKDHTIPLVLLVFGIVLAIAYLAISLEQGLTAKAVLEGFIQGLLCAAVAVYGNNVFKQLTIKKD